MRAFIFLVLGAAVVCSTSARADGESAILPSGCCVSVVEDPLHPSALETAAYLFTTGYTHGKERLLKFKGGDFKEGDPNEGATTNLFEESGLYVVYTWAKESNHCVFRYQETNPPYRAAELDFNKLSDRPPSVDMSVTGSYLMLTFPGVQGAFCAGSKPVKSW
jgi:hypothetical protein